MADPFDLAALERLESLERRATPGPWATDHEHTVAGEDEATLLCHALCQGGWTRVEDADLIVALRNAAPALLRAARAAAEVLEILDVYEEIHSKEWPCLAGALRILRAAAGAAEGKGDAS